MNRRIAKKVLRRDMEAVGNWEHRFPYRNGQLIKALLLVRRDERKRGIGRWSPMGAGMRRYYRATGDRMGPALFDA